MRDIKVSENEGELSFGVIWISLDRRININWYQTYKEAKKHYLHLTRLGLKPSLNVRLEEDLDNGKSSKF